MEKIKKILSPGSKQDDEAMYDTGSSQQPTGPTGKLTGQGSHFASAQLPTDSAGYSLGKGPEALGGREDSSHVNTLSSGTAIPESTATTSTTTQPLSGDGSGQAAIGQTTTYSSHPLRTGDKTSSVVDPSSSDSTTYKKPESSAAVGSGAGVAPGAAEAAARTAMYPDTHMPGEYPEDDSNPYSSSSLDPRVDSAGHAPASSQAHTGTGVALGAGAGVAGLGAYESTKQEAAAPPTLTSTTNPTERHDTYGPAVESRGLESATATTESPTAGQSVVGKVLGALGLGGAAAAVTHEASKDSAIDSTPSTAAGADAFRTPSQSGPPPAHHRKESIPTTAYPAGTLDSVRPIAGTSPAHHRKESIPTTAYPTGSLDSVRAIAGPTGQQRSQKSSDHHYGRDAAIGGGAAGAAALGASEYEKSQQQASQVSAPPSSQNLAPESGLAATRGTAADVPSDVSTSVHDATTKDPHHYGRDAAIGGAAVGATGLAAHEYEKNRSDPSATAGGVTSTSQQYGNQPIAGQDAAGFSEQVDPRTDASGNAKQGTGIAAVPVPPTTEGEAKEQHHYGRDAALVGGGAAAAGYGAHEISEHEAEKAEKQRNKLQKQQIKDVEKEQKAQEKEIKKEQKAQEKAEKKHEKEVAKQEKKEQKEQEKAEKQHQKEVAKEEKRQEKELQKEESRHDKEGEAVAAVGTGAAGVGAAHEYEKHHGPAAVSGLTGLAAADAVDKETYDKQNRYTTALADPSADPTVARSSLTGSGTDHHDSRDAVAGGVGAAAIGGGAVAAEKHHAGDAPGTAQPVSGLAAADEVDRQAYGQKEKKPGFFKRIFKRKKNEQTGESEDDENDYEDVPHDHPEGTAVTGGESPTSSRTHDHVEGELMKPSYNPFKKEIASDYGAVKDRI